MARLTFYPSDDAYVRAYTGEPQAGIPVTVWTRQSGGTQVTDLVSVGYDGTLGAAITGGVLYSNSDGLLPAFAGPDGGAAVLWGSHGVSGERLALYSVSGSGGGGGGSVFSVVGQTGTVTGSQILADSTVSTALSAKAPLASPTFTGTPTVPTATAGTNTTQAASTAFVTTAVASGGGGGGGAVSSVVGQTGSVTGTQILADSTISTALGLKAPLTSPALTGTPTVPTASPGTNTTQVATTAFVTAADAALTGTFGPGSDQWLKSNGAAFAFAFITITTSDSATGLPTAATIRWPDGTNGAFTGTTTADGYTGFTATWVGATTRTLTASGISYDSNGVPVGPTALAVS